MSDSYIGVNFEKARDTIGVIAGLRQTISDCGSDLNSNLNSMKKYWVENPDRDNYIAGLNNEIAKIETLVESLQQIIVDATAYVDNLEARSKRTN